MHLEEIAFHVAPDTHAVVILDQAGWHGPAELVVPPNITLLPLPPRCPELNPVEDVWQYMRDNWLSNRIVKSYDDIVDHCCFAWNTSSRQASCDWVSDTVPSAADGHTNRPLSSLLA